MHSLQTAQTKTMARDWNWRPIALSLASLFGFKFARRQIALETLNSIFVFMYVLGEHVQYWYCSESEKELRRYDRDMQIYINTLYF
jgi:hypothetical protein